MEKYTVFETKKFTEERKFYRHDRTKFRECCFEKGQYQIKESLFILLDRSIVRSKYFLWYNNYADAVNSAFYPDAADSMWYCENLTLDGCIVNAPRCFRRCDEIVLDNTSIINSNESLWNCTNVHINNLNVNGDYFGKDSKFMFVDNITLTGDYAFDGCEYLDIHNSHIVSNDAFWNCMTVNICDSYISGDRIGWNSSMISLENCTVESMRAFSYSKKLYMKNCRLLNAAYAFEMFTGVAQIKTPITSVLTPCGGTIGAPSIGELILEDGEKKNVCILCKNIEKRLEHPTWEDL